MATIIVRELGFLICSSIIDFSNIWLCRFDHQKITYLTPLHNNFGTGFLGVGGEERVWNGFGVGCYHHAPLPSPRPPQEVRPADGPPPPIPNCTIQA